MLRFHVFKMPEQAFARAGLFLEMQPARICFTPIRRAGRLSDGSRICRDPTSIHQFHLRCAPLLWRVAMSVTPFSKSAALANVVPGGTSWKSLMTSSCC